MKMNGLLMLLALSSAAACADKKPAEGPMEHAGKKVDQAAADTKDAAKDAADKTEEKTDEAGQKIKEKTKGDD